MGRNYLVASRQPAFHCDAVMASQIHCNRNLRQDILVVLPASLLLVFTAERLP